jgi:hypothetical protein
MAIHDGRLLIRAAANAAARGHCLGGNLLESGGTFRFLTSFSGNSGSKFAKVKNFQERTRNCGHGRPGERGWVGKYCTTS